LKDYDFKLHYHPRKGNVVVNALSRRCLHISSLMVQEIVLLEKFRDLNLSITLSHDKMKLSSIQIASNLRRQIREAQVGDDFL